MVFIGGIKSTLVFHMVEKVVKNVSTTSEEISPQSFYLLVVDTFA